MKIGVVIPAHNEEETIMDCLTSIKIAAKQLPTDIEVAILVVLDSCNDQTELKVQHVGVQSISCDFKCVGQARDLGTRLLIQQGATWIACTDADSLVAADWLAQQVAHLKQHRDAMICGVVEIDQWDHLTTQTREQYLAHYQDCMGHHHIHGANLSFEAAAYLAVGGFDAMPCHEDVNLVKKFEAKGYSIGWSNQVRVTTSSRLVARATEGFAHFLSNLESQTSHV